MSKVRLARDDRFMLAAIAQATGGTCARRRVGCILVDSRGIQLSSGFNGPPAGQRHCVEIACPGAELASGTGLDECHAVHGEANALMQCRDVWQIDTCYSTTAPCIHCVKMLMNTSCNRVVYMEDYPHPTSRKMWMESSPKRYWEQYDPSSPQAAAIVRALHAHVILVLG